MYQIKIFLFFIPIFFIGCSNSNQIKLIKGNKEIFILNKNISLNNTVYLPKSTINVTYKKGKYISYSKDNMGTYYKGPEYCYTWIPINTSLHSITANCGIYIFNDKLKPYKPYHYVNSIKRITDNKMANDILQNTYGLNTAMMTMFDPEVVFEKEFQFNPTNKIKWIQK